MVQGPHVSVIALGQAIAACLFQQRIKQRQADDRGNGDQPIADAPERRFVRKPVQSRAGIKTRAVKRQCQQEKHEDINGEQAADKIAGDGKHRGNREIKNDIGAHESAFQRSAQPIGDDGRTAQLRSARKQPGQKSGKEG